MICPITRAPAAPRGTSYRSPPISDLCYRCVVCSLERLERPRCMYAPVSDTPSRDPYLMHGILWWVAPGAVRLRDELARAHGPAGRGC